MIKKNNRGNTKYNLQKVIDRYRNYSFTIYLIFGFEILLGLILFITLVHVYMVGLKGEELNLDKILYYLSVSIFSIVSIVWTAVSLFRISSRKKMASLIGQRGGGRVSFLLSAVELESYSDEHFSKTLIDAHLSEAYQYLTSISPGKILPFKKVFLSTVILIIIISSSYLFVDKNRQTVNLGFNRAFSSSAEVGFELSSSLNPVLQDLSAVITYPDYLNRKKRIIKSLSGGIKIPKGAQILFTGFPVNEDVTSGSINLSTGEKLLLSINPDRSVSGKITHNNSEWFYIELINGNKKVRGPNRILETEEDLPPEIRFVRPLQDVEVNLEDELYIDYEAADDHAISRVELVVTGDNGLEFLRTLFIQENSQKRLRRDYRWLPSSVKLGDVSEVEAVLKVYDNDVQSGPKYGQSKPLKIKIITPQNRTGKLIDIQKDILFGLVDLLAARLETPLPVSYDKAKEITERFHQMREVTNDVLKYIATLEKEILDTDKYITLKEVYSQIRTDLSNQILFESGLNELPLASYKKRSSVEKVTVYLIEKAIAHVDNIILDQQFADLFIKGNSLKVEQDELAENFKRYLSGHSENTRRSILAKLVEMEANVSQLLSRISKISGQVSFNQVSGTIDSTINLKNVFKKIRSRLAEGKIDEAAMLAQSIDSIIKSMMTNLEAGHLAFKTERFGDQEEFVEKLLRKLEFLEKDQLNVRRNTISVKISYNEQLVISMKHKIAPLVANQKGRVEKLRAEVEQLYKNINKNTDPANLEEVLFLRKMSKRVDETLKQGDLGETLQITGHIIKMSDTLLNDKINDVHLKKIISEAKKISDNINRAFPSPSKLFLEKDKKNLKNQSFKQRHLKNQCSKLIAWINKSSKEIKQIQFISNHATESISSAKEDMENGVKALEERKIEEAIRLETSALDKLMKLQKSLNNSGKMVLLQSDDISGENHVFIPSKNETKVSGELREDIINAMKANTPKEYKDAVEKYYEALIN
ncbi:MAG: hypothetical protein JXR91_15685 [Deltaproteobacteria bacterium]|nr:hypothetical protein [Deltaproteobacteria bacterium]